MSGLGLPKGQPRLMSWVVKDAAGKWLGHVEATNRADAEKLAAERFGEAAAVVEVFEAL